MGPLFTPWILLNATRMNLRDRLHYATKLRLSYNQDIVKFLHQALSLLLHPQNLSCGLQELKEIPQNILQKAGDASSGVRPSLLRNSSNSP
jgi:ubiquinone biosynthesis protein COQ9